MIRGGYYIKARAIQESDIAHCSPCAREIWDYLLREASYQDTKVNKRGQLIRTISDIQEALHWKIGYRKEVYSQDQCEKAMKLLANAGMIAKTKTVRGLVITVCNYDYYQTSENYEGGNEGGSKAAIRRESSGTINKKERNKEKNIGAAAPVLKLVTEVDKQFAAFNEWLSKYAGRVLKMKEPITIEQYHKLQQDFNTPALKNLLTETLRGMHDWEPLNKRRSANLTVREWARRAVEKNPSLYETTINANGTTTGKTAAETLGEEILRRVDGGSGS